MSRGYNRTGRPSDAQQTGLARALSKLGFCSRSQAWALIKEGRVMVNHRPSTDPETRVALRTDRIEVNGQLVGAASKVYLMLNKPRGLVSTATDEHGRETVFSCFRETDLPQIAPVGRLDMASEGLLLFTNDNAWAAQITSPASHLDKTYHVQIDCLADQGTLQRLRGGIHDQGEKLKVNRVQVLRQGSRNCWLEIVLDEGKNRHIRRMLAALNIHVLRLIRVAIGPLPLGTLAKGAWRYLTLAEAQALGKEGKCAAAGAAVGSAKTGCKPRALQRFGGA
jgi:23S rRNA pseudouridine2605 synthase